MTQRNPHLEEAITRAGGIIAFAKALGVTHQAVSAWRKKGYVPPDRARQIENATGINRALLVSRKFLASVNSWIGDEGDVL